MDSTNKCQLCNTKEAKYVCPRCNITYCSLVCYQSQVHSQCSESFYKDCVVEQIKSEDVDPQSQCKMMEILQRVQDIDEKLENDEEKDSDDEDSEDELAARLTGVDLDDADSVWERLTSEEKHQFEELLRSGDVSEVVPPWEPWWLYREEKKLVEDLKTPGGPDFPSNIPKHLENIQPLSNLFKVSPSPCVRWNVINVLAAYSLVARIYNGDYIGSALDAVTTLVSLSGNLSANQVFDGPESAVAAVHLAAVSNNCVPTGLDEKQLKEDVQKIVEGPSESQKNVYVLSALSEIHYLLSASKRKLKEFTSSKDKGEFSKRFPDASSSYHKQITVSEVNKHSKKIEFYLSWAVEYFQSLMF